MNIFSMPSLRILRYLGPRYRESFYVRQIAKDTGISVGSASESLRSLAEYDLVRSEPRGRTLLYQGNITSPLLREMKILFSIHELTPLLLAIRGGSRTVILFGSCSTGEDVVESDMDLFVISEHRRQILRAIAAHQETVIRKISPVIASPGEAQEIRFRDPPLFERIRQGKALAGEGL